MNFAHKRLVLLVGKINGMENHLPSMDSGHQAPIFPI
jgi:hypothetical protein